MTTLGYRRGLDGLRAIAAGVVVLFHLGLGGARGGWLGVDLFFVLSGFLITTLLLEECDRNRRLSLRRFYARRALRLFPALYALVLAALALSFVTRSPAAASSIRGEALAAATYSMDVFKGEFATKYLVHTWSLAVEEQFYLLWPLVLGALMRKRVRPTYIAVLCIVLVTGAALGRGLFETGDNVVMATRADGILLGCAVALVRHHRPTSRLVGWLRSAWPLALGVLAIAFSGAVELSQKSGFGVTVAGLASMSVILQVVDRPSAALDRALSIAPLVAIGKVSYGLYLWHVFVFRVLSGLRPHLPLLVHRAALLTATAAVTVASYFVIERPALRLKSRFTAPAPTPTPNFEHLSTETVAAVHPVSRLSAAGTP